LYFFFFIAILQDYARQTHTAYENVKFDIMLVNVDQTKAPDRGIYIKGLKLIGANWDYSRGVLMDNCAHESVNIVPCVSYIYIYFKDIVYILKLIIIIKLLLIYVYININI